MTEELAVIEQPPMAVQPMSLFGDVSPAEVVRSATATADALMDVVKKRGLAKGISGRQYLLVEAWTLLGSMLGVFPVCEWTREVEDGWEARVEARTLSGAVVGAAEAECLRSEKSWKNRDDYALRSMAQTRAIAKALRMPLGFIAVLAGFEATPADEMPSDSSEPAAGDSQASGRAGSEESRRTIPQNLAELDNLFDALALADDSTDWKESAANMSARLFGERDFKKLKAGELDSVVKEVGRWLANATPPSEPFS